MNVLLTALLGVLVGWYLRHVLAGSKLAELESTWQSNARAWTNERETLLGTATELSKRGSELEIELGTTTASFTRQIEETARQHTAEVTGLRARMTALERERDDVGRQLSDVARKSAVLDGELRATLARHRNRTARLEEDLVAARQERDHAQQECAVAQQRAAELSVATGEEAGRWAQQMAELERRAADALAAQTAQHADEIAQWQARLAAVEQERDVRQRHLTELTRRAAATEAELHVRITLLESRLRQLATSRAAAQPGRPSGAVDLRQDFPRLAAQAASVLSAWQERTQQLDGQLHALLDQSQAHRIRYQKHLDAIRHELNAAQQRLDAVRPPESVSAPRGRVVSERDATPRSDATPA